MTLELRRNYRYRKGSTRLHITSGVQQSSTAPAHYSASVRHTSVKALVISAAVAIVAAGETVEPEMSADRPGFRNSTHLVGPGVAQVETGLNLSTGRALALQPTIRV